MLHGSCRISCRFVLCRSHVSYMINCHAQPTDNKPSSLLCSLYCKGKEALRWLTGVRSTLPQSPSGLWCHSADSPIWRYFSSSPDLLFLNLSTQLWGTNKVNHQQKLHIITTPPPSFTFSSKRPTWVTAPMLPIRVRTHVSGPSIRLSSGSYTSLRWWYVNPSKQLTLSWRFFLRSWFWRKVWLINVRVQLQVVLQTPENIQKDSKIIVLLRVSLPF